MTVTSKLVLLGILFSILSYGGYRVHQSIWQSGYNAALLEIKEANEAAVRENEQIAREEAREIAKVVPVLEKQRLYYQSLLLKASNLPKEIKEEPVDNVQIIRVFGLSDDGFRLYNDAIRGYPEPPPEVRPELNR